MKYNVSAYIILVIVVLVIICDSCKEDPAIPVKEWQQLTNGLPMGKLTTITALSTNGYDIYAGTLYSFAELCTSSIYKSSDNGDTWTKASFGFPENTLINSIVFNGSKIFAATEDKGIWMSEDNGATWKTTGFVYTDTYVRVMWTNGNGLFAGTNKGVFMSDDYGTSWNTINNGLPSDINVTACAVNGQNTYIGLFDHTAGKVKVYISSDNGGLWTYASDGLPNSSISEFATSGTDIFAATWQGVYKSSDNGTNWTDLNNGLPYPVKIKSIITCGSDAFAGSIDNNKIMVYVMPLNENIWHNFTSKFPENIEFWNVILLIKGQYIFAGTSQGLWRTSLY